MYRYKNREPKKKARKSDGEEKRRNKMKVLLETTKHKYKKSTKLNNTPRERYVIYVLPS